MGSRTRRAFEELASEKADAGFKHALFIFEASGLPGELKVCADIARLYSSLPEAATTRVIQCAGMDDAAVLIDTFRHKTCGSSFSLAIVNLNNFGSVEELQFLMRKDVLGDPRTIFLGTLRFMNGALYTQARAKVDREAQLRFGAPSCIDSYAALSRADIPPRTARLTSAYLKDADERARVGRDGSVFMQRTSPALDELYKIPSAFYGSRPVRK